MYARNKVASTAVALVVLMAGTSAVITLAQVDPAKLDELAEANRINAQVETLFGERKLDEALPLARRVLEIRERLLGKEHLLVAAALNNLLLILSEKRKYGDALPLSLRAVAIIEKSGNKEMLAHQLINLGWLYFADRDMDKARSAFERALVINRSLHGEDDLKTAQALVVLGDFYERQELHGKAIDFYSRALEIRERKLGAGHPDVTGLAKKCWCELLQDRQIEEASKMLARAWKPSSKSDSGEPARAGGLLQASAVRRVEPAYPVAARNARVAGIVVVEVLVDENGNVLRAEAICGPQGLRGSSEAAARGWRFRPTALSGKPVKVTGTITFNFRL
jgi:TonB family protein